jgi:hypothetical protein
MLPTYVASSRLPRSVQLERATDYIPAMACGLVESCTDNDRQTQLALAASDG